jgi:hypothetical protein
LNQEDINHPNRFITSSEIKAVIRSLPTKNKPVLDRFYQHFKKELTPMLLKLFHKIKSEEMLPNSFCEDCIILTSKPDKDTTKKEKMID